MVRKRKKWANREKIAKMFTVSLHEILLRFHAPKKIDYMSLDVEGAEELILNNFPFNKYSFSILTIERPSDNLKSILIHNGYLFVRQITSWGETFWINAADKDFLNMTYFEYHYLDNFSRYEM
jgi:Methyltransferase FkbM domain